MNRWVLPTSVTVAEVVWKIRTDFRIVIDVLIAFDNPEYDQMDKWLYCMMSLVEDFDNLPEENYEEMCLALLDFIDMGSDKSSKKTSKKLMDWEQDATMVVSAVNKVVGQEIRTLDYLHWWSFMGSYMEIDDKSLFSHVLSIRAKKAKEKKLEDWEQKFYQENKALIDIKEKLTAEEEEEREVLKDLFGFEE